MGSLVHRSSSTNTDHASINGGYQGRLQRSWLTSLSQMSRDRLLLQNWCTSQELQSYIFCHNERSFKNSHFKSTRLEFSETAATSKRGFQTSTSGKAQALSWGHTQILGWHWHGLEGQEHQETDSGGSSERQKRISLRFCWSSSQVVSNISESFHQ